MLFLLFLIGTNSKLIRSYVGLKPLGTFYRVLQASSVQTFPPIIVISSGGSFVYLNWDCKSIYRRLSYP